MIQPGETPIEHKLMLVFFDLGVGRDLSQLSVRTGLPVGELRDIYARCRWEERLSAYQKYLDTTISALFSRQIAADASEAQKMVVSLIRNKVGFLQQKALMDTNDYSLNDLLEQIMRLCKIFDALNKRSLMTDEDKSGRNINIMFQPVIDTARGAMEIKTTTFEDADNGEEEKEGQGQQLLGDEIERA